MACKELGWHNWPYRKVKSVRKARQAVDTLDEGFNDPAAKDRVKSVLEREEHKILQDPSKALDPDFKRFRQTIYKQDHGKKAADISD